MDNNYDKSPQILKDFLHYIRIIKGLSDRTVNGYFIDLRTFFRFILMHKKLVSINTPFNEISIEPITIEIIRTITLSDVYEFLNYVTNTRENNAQTRSRKSSSIRSFFNYLTVKVHLLNENPIKELEVPNAKKRLPKYLTLEQSIELLSKIDGEYKERDYCIITLFINCGMRLSELVRINLSDIRENTLRLLGKGNKERIIYLNNACISAIETYKTIRGGYTIKPDSKNALFITRTGSRISTRRVQEIVEHNLKLAGLENYGFSTHKLRHTAATLLYQHGNVDVLVLKDMLGHANVGTTEIYTHLSNKQLEQAANKSPLSNIKMKPTKPKSVWVVYAK